jgi:Ca2+-binding EF-hand superfamily protein
VRERGAHTLAAHDTRWDTKIIKNVYESLLSADMTLKELISMFDQDGDGLVSPHEFKQAIQQANLRIPEGQVNALLRAIDRDASGKLQVAAFLDRFQVVYSRSSNKTLPPETEAALKRIGRLLIGSRDRVEVFKSIDTNGDGFVDESEFYESLSKLKVHDLSDADKRALWGAVDLNHDGHLNYREFCAAFQVPPPLVLGGHAASLTPY